MSAELNYVYDFHDKFNLPIRQTPSIPPKEEIALRIKLLREEVDELEKALYNEDKVNVLQELTDIQYVLCGTYLSCGMQDYYFDAFDRVHESNMSKLWPDGEPRYNEYNKVIKPPGYKPVDLSDLIKD